MGTDKAEIDVGGMRMIDRVVDAVSDATQVIVVGPPRRTARPVVWLREDPPGGGPLPAVLAGLSVVTAPFVAVVAVDMPLFERATIEALRAAVGDHDAAVLVDVEERIQPLAAFHRTERLRAA
ncbi:MAG TPA: NTP transferase domain-containing protein, partial [Actinomycetota bacterium]|nr:NTP transferase domain-containing protein [Actinomycetota bacterium]